MIKQEMEATNEIELGNPDMPDRDLFMAVQLAKQQIWDRMIIDHQIYNIELAVAAETYGFEEEPEVLAMRKTYEDQMMKLDNERMKAEGIGFTEEHEQYLAELLKKVGGPIGDCDLNEQGLMNEKDFMKIQEVLVRL